MPLEPGRQLGPYQIEAPLGAGGMGEVYKATDTRLDRTVAIKVLPEHVAADPELKQRFEREARTVAALNHPHICTLYDIGREGETDFLVMEYLDGETVAQRLEKGALPLDQALQVAIAIADALDKAHRQGIVHRDLKPGNIMLTKAGAKLLDFGLAKLKPTEQAGGLSALPTQPANLTQEGAILGTFQYMAPEQLEGQEADARTDIFAFGAVVYEMVTGKKAFEGKSQASLIAAILERDPPPMSDLQAMSPALLDSVVKTCLAKDPEGRWQSAGDVGRQLEFIQGGSRPSVAARVVVAPEPVRSRRARGLAVTALVLGLAIGGVGVWSVMQPAPRSVARFAIPVKGLATSINAGINSPVALSPDGKTVAYLSVREGAQLYQRSLDQLEAVPIRGTEGACCPFFSPDGEWVGFWSATGQVLQKMPISGGLPSTLAPLTFHRNFTWGPNDTIMYGGFGTEAGLWEVAASGGTPQRIATPDRDSGELLYVAPTYLPDGRAALFHITYGSGRNSQIAVRWLETGEQKVLLEGTTPRVTTTGHLIFARADSLWAAPFDASRLKLDDEPVPVLQGVRTNFDFAHYALGGDGSLVYVAGAAGISPQLTLVWVDRNGREEPVGTIPQSGQYIYPRISPDGTRVALGIKHDVSGDTDLWVLGIESGSRTQLTFGGENQFFPVWTPDGARLTFADGIDPTNRIRWTPAGGGGEMTALLDRGRRQFPTSWASDGLALAFYEDQTGTQTGRDLWILPVDADGTPGTPVEFLATSFEERAATFSPNGRWLAYVSDKSGQDEVYVRPYPSAGHRSTRSRQVVVRNRSGRRTAASSFTAPPTK